MTDTKPRPWSATSERVDETLGSLTLDEKISLLAGANLWETNSIDRIGLPSLRVSDGPNGARGSDGNHGPTSTSYPVGVAMGATFDPALIEDVGRSLAHETRTKGADVLLGPTVNIPRVPVAGRNFECFSEDPILSGILAASYIEGLQSEGVAACIKHFVCNDQEHERHTIDIHVDERTLREIYLEPFRIAVERGRPWSAMSAYNAVNGYPASESGLLDDVLRAEFGFDGAILSDWYGTYSPGVVGSGLDLEMPGPARWMGSEHVRAGLGQGTIDEGSIDIKVRRILTLMDRTGALDRREQVAEHAGERPEDRALVRRVGHESIVALKNKGALPMVRPARIAVIGDLARRTPHQGGGSSAVAAHRLTSILDGIEAIAPAGTEVVWSLGTPVRRGHPVMETAQVTGDEGTSGFSVEYYRGIGFEGEPARTIVGAKSHFTFFGSGDGWVDFDSFSLRITGSFEPNEAGSHLFAVNAKGRVRAWANGDVVIDTWNEPSAELQEWTMDLTQGETVDIRVEYRSGDKGNYRWLNIECQPPVPDTDTIADARDLASRSDVAVVVVGLTSEWEGEGFDREDLRLPNGQDRLVSEVAAVQPNTVVVTVAGSAIEMPWVDEVSAILHTWYLGQEGGLAVADVLFGYQDPSGRLPVTFPADSRQHPGLLNYPGEAGRVRYGEGVYVGYRAYDRLGLDPLFPFGHGMSYTSFVLESASASASKTGVTIAGRLANVGERNGTEVVQVYALHVGGVERKLVGFAKVRLNAGEAVDIEISIAPDLLRWWDPSSHDWVGLEGEVAFAVNGTFGAHHVSTLMLHG